MSINAETGHQTQASIGGRILRMRDLRERLGLTASHIYAMVAAGRFPKPFPIIPGGRATGWLESTIDAYLTNCSTAAPEPDDAERLKAENERLREALGKYGRHLDDCALTLGGYQCTCGFNQQEVPR